MQTNPVKFQFMLMSLLKLSPQSITLGNDTVLTSESQVKALGVMIDSNLNFSSHVSNICKKAARQLNALSRISKFIDTRSKTIVYNSFIASNFTYCPLVWHFCGKINNGKIDKIQERSLKIIYKDYESTYDQLLDKASASDVLTMRLRSLTLEVFKSLTHRNTPCFTQMFQTKRVNYSMRHPYLLLQPQRRTTTHGLRSISYIGAKIWNNLPLELNSIKDMPI